MRRQREAEAEKAAAEGRGNPSPLHFFELAIRLEWLKTFDFVFVNEFLTETANLFVFVMIYLLKLFFFNWFCKFKDIFVILWKAFF